MRSEHIFADTFHIYIASIESENVNCIYFTLYLIRPRYHWCYTRVKENSFINLHPTTIKESFEYTTSFFYLV